MGFCFLFAVHAPKEVILNARKALHTKFSDWSIDPFLTNIYEGGSICNENPFITPSTNVLGLYAICQTKDQSTAVIMVHETLFYLSKFNKLQTF